MAENGGQEVHDVADDGEDDDGGGLDDDKCKNQKRGSVTYEPLCQAADQSATRADSVDDTPNLQKHVQARVQAAGDVPFCPFERAGDRPPRTVCHRKHVVRALYRHTK